jgi:hypothetical protein
MERLKPSTATRSPARRTILFVAEIPAIAFHAVKSDQQLEFTEIGRAKGWAQVGRDHVGRCVMVARGRQPSQSLDERFETPARPHGGASNTVEIRPCILRVWSCALRLGANLTGATGDRSTRATTAWVDKARAPRVSGGSGSRAA